MERMAIYFAQAIPAGRLALSVTQGGDGTTVRQLAMRREADKIVPSPRIDHRVTIRRVEAAASFFQLFYALYPTCSNKPIITANQFHRTSTGELEHKFHAYGPVPPLSSAPSSVYCILFVHFRKAAYLQTLLQFSSSSCRGSATLYLPCFTVMRVSREKFTSLCCDFRYPDPFHVVLNNTQYGVATIWYVICPLVRALTSANYRHHYPGWWPPSAKEAKRD